MVDVLPEDTLARMPYDTLHKYNGSNQYACVDV